VSTGGWLGDNPEPAPEPIPGVFDEPLPVFGGGDASDDEFDEQLRLMAERKKTRSRLLILAGIALLIFVGFVGVTGVVVSVIAGSGSPTAEPAAVDGEPEPEPEAVPEPQAEEAEPEPQPEPEPEPTEGKRPAPAPASAPSPAPAPAAPKPSSAKSFADRGWQVVTGQPAKAVELFGKALAIDAGHADANYGMGYALLQQGKGAQAKPYLCTAQTKGDTEIKRDVGSLLANNNLSCP